MANFVKKNIELISDYDALEGSYPFDSCQNTIMERISTANSNHKGIDFKTVLKQALRNAIQDKESVLDSLQSVLNECTKDNGDINTTQIYFKDVGRVYKKNNYQMDYEYCPENRDKLIEMNTKMVISIAKKYQGMGLTLQELISAGNLGLCTAWEKYDPAKSHLRDDILAEIGQLPDKFNTSKLFAIVDKYFSYGNARTKFEERFPKGTYKKSEVIEWVENNIYNAKFSSVCMMWIKAFILMEIDSTSRVVKKPKSEIYKDKEKTGTYQRETLINLDAHLLGDTETTVGEMLGSTDETETDMGVREAYIEYKDGLNKLLEGVSVRDRTVTLKKFGIGFPRPLLPKEISEQENLSIARISQIVLNTINAMRANAAKYEIDASRLFEACLKIR